MSNGNGNGKGKSKSKSKSKGVAAISLAGPLDSDEEGEDDRFVPIIVCLLAIQHASTPFDDDDYAVFCLLVVCFGPFPYFFHFLRFHFALFCLWVVCFGPLS